MGKGQLEDLLLQRVRVHVENVDGHDVGRMGGAPSAGGGSGNAVPNGVLDVARRPDEIAKAMVVSALLSGRGSHASIVVWRGREENSTSRRECKSRPGSLQRARWGGRGATTRRQYCRMLGQIARIAGAVASRYDGGRLNRWIVRGRNHGHE